MFAFGASKEWDVSVAPEVAVGSVLCGALDILSHFQIFQVQENRNSVYCFVQDL